MNQSRPCSQQLRQGHATKVLLENLRRFPPIATPTAPASPVDQNFPLASSRVNPISSSRLVPPPCSIQPSPTVPSRSFTPLILTPIPANTFSSSNPSSEVIRQQRCLVGISCTPALTVSPCPTISTVSTHAIGQNAQSTQSVDNSTELDSPSSSLRQSFSLIAPTEAIITVSFYHPVRGLKSAVRERIGSLILQL